MGGEAGLVVSANVAGLNLSAQRRVATLVVSAMIFAGIASAAYGSATGPQFRAFLPLVMGSIIITELMSAYLLLAQFMEMRSKALVFAGAAYLSAGLLVIPYLLTFPRVFTETGLFGANAQTAVSLWFLWHALFPLLILLYACSDAFAKREVSSVWARRGVLLASAACVFVTLAAAYVATKHKEVLPILIAGGTFTRTARWIALPAVVVLDGAALLALFAIAKIRTETQLWLAVAVVASLLDALMGILYYRYTRLVCRENFRVYFFGGGYGFISLLR